MKNASSSKPQPTRQTPPKKKGRAPLPWPSALAAFSILLVIPLWAAIKLSAQLDGRAIAGFFGAISVLTGSFYWSDKRRAQLDQWRIPEATLHFWELLGGWPAALLAQRFLRHKRKKASYQMTFWLIIALHQFLGLDFVMNRLISGSIWRAFQQ